MYTAAIITSRPLVILPSPPIGDIVKPATMVLQEVTFEQDLDNTRPSTMSLVSVEKIEITDIIRPAIMSLQLIEQI